MGADRDKLHWRRQRRAIKRILDAIGPPPAAQMECLRTVTGAVRAIARAAPRELPGKVKLQLAALKRARAALKRLDAPDWCIKDLDRITLDRSAILAPLRYPVFAGDGSISGSRIVKRDVVASGGGKDARHDARRKEVAAALAFELRIRFCDGFPEGAHFYELADLLVEAATGRAGKCNHACADFLQAVHRGVEIDKRAWRRR
jgi:hypothetical protein